MRYASILRSFFVAGLVGVGAMAGVTSINAEISAQTPSKADTARAQVVDEIFSWNRAHAAPLFDSPHQTVIGNPNGKITLVEFFDYNCLHCRHMVDDLGRLMKANPDFRVVLVDFPILTPKSVEASRVAIALRSQFDPDKYWQFFQNLMSGHHAVDGAHALAAAQALGADMARLNNDLNSAEVTARLAELKTIAHALNFGATPSFVMGDSVFWGEQSYDKMNGFIKNMRQCGKTSCG
jgi:protein-disulfide isomerase